MNVLQKLEKEQKGSKKLVWVSLREEAVCYINGIPFVLRETDKPYSNITHTGISGEQVEGMEERLMGDVIEESKLYENHFLYHTEEEEMVNEISSLKLVSKWIKLENSKLYSRNSHSQPTTTSHSHPPLHSHLLLSEISPRRSNTNSSSLSTSSLSSSTSTISSTLSSTSTSSTLSSSSTSSLSSSSKSHIPRLTINSGSSSEHLHPRDFSNLLVDTKEEESYFPGILFLYLFYFHLFSFYFILFLYLFYFFQLDYPHTHVMTPKKIFQTAKKYTSFGLSYHRIPVTDEKEMEQKDVDEIVNILYSSLTSLNVSSHENVPIFLFNCQMGRGR